MIRNDLLRMIQEQGAGRYLVLTIIMLNEINNNKLKCHT